MKKKYEAGDYDGAKRDSRRALLWLKIGTGVGIVDVIIMCIVAYYFGIVI